MKNLKGFLRWAFYLISLPAAIYLLMGFTADCYDLSAWNGKAILLLAFLAFVWVLVTLFFHLFKEMLQEGEE